MVLLNFSEDQARRLDIVALESPVVVATNLSLQHHYHVGTPKMMLPFTADGNVCVFGNDPRLNTAEHRKIGSMPIEDHDIRIPSGTQSGNEVLTNQARASGQNYFSVYALKHGCVDIMPIPTLWRSHNLRRLNTASGSTRITTMISHQNPGT
jgi:hypothetical protein